MKTSKTVSATKEEVLYNETFLPQNVKHYIFL